MSGLREVAFDTETTGLSNETDRVVEIACVEMIDMMPTGRVFNVLVNPQRDIPDEVVKIHGITDEMVKGKPTFQGVVDEFFEFIGNDRLVAHNANFDIEMINAELRRIGRPPLANPFVDTVSLARQQFAGAKVTLDALCRRFGIDLSTRTLHAALLDTQLLTRVYLELNGGAHRKLNFAKVSALDGTRPELLLRPAREFFGAPSHEEAEKHLSFIAGVKNTLWSPAPSGPMPGR